MSRPKRAADGYAYRLARDAALRQADWRCQLRFPGCTGRATCADHDFPVSRFPHLEAHTALRAACAECNMLKGARTMAEARAEFLPAEVDPYDFS